jgi:hypothetical protein
VGTARGQLRVLAVAEAARLVRELPELAGNAKAAASGALCFCGSIVAAADDS